MGVQVNWVLFFITDNQELGSPGFYFITDNQEVQHGSPGVLGFIFYDGQPRNPTWESRCTVLQCICTSILSSCKHRTKHIDCTVSNMHEVNQNEVIDVRWASSVANARISLIVFVLLKEHSMKHRVVST